MADMTNAIANFGWQAGQNIQNTVGNALARNEERRRYENKLTAANLTREQAAAKQQEAAEREYGKGWATAYFTAPEDKRDLILQGGVRKAMQQGYIKPEEAGAINGDYMYRLAAETGVDFGGGGDLPADVQSTQWLLNQPEDVRALHLKNKRGESVLNLGGTQIVRDPAGRVVDQYQVTPKPQDMPGFKAQVAGAQEGAKLGQQLEIKPQIERAVATQKNEAKKDASSTKIRSAYEAAKAKTSRVTSLIDDVVVRVNGLTAGAGGKLMAIFPETAATDLEADLSTIKANLGFSELKDMRDSSPTGGALGNITERELAFLQSVMANLEQSQSPAQLKRNLLRAKSEVKAMWGRVDEAYRQEYGEPSQSSNGGWSIRKVK